MANKQISRYGIHNQSSDRYAARIKALKEARIYLAPHRDIWANLKLINKYCKLTLGKDGVTIEGFERAYPYRHFKVINTGMYTPDELWNMFCIYFSWNKSYDGLLEDCQRRNISIVKDINKNAYYGKSAVTNRTKSIQNKQLQAPAKFKEDTSQNTEKLDINNCSEIELTELPGISIVLAKKAIKKREEIGGFKTVDDFFLYMKLKPHMENQLREIIKVEKMKGSVIRQLNTERTIDL